MLYEQGQCYPKNSGYTYKLYIKNKTWESKVYYKKRLIGVHIVGISYTPIYGMDIQDAGEIDKGIAKIVKKHRRNKNVKRTR